MYVSPTGLGQLRRGTRAIRVPAMRRAVGLGQNCAFQTTQNPIGTFVDPINGQPISGPPWCVINSNPACGPNSSGLLASCADANALPSSGFNPANFLPPITVCADQSEVGSGNPCPASVGYAAGQGTLCADGTMQGNGSNCAGHGGVAATNGGSPVLTTPAVLAPPSTTVSSVSSAQPATPTAGGASSCWSLFQGDPCLGPIGMGTLAVGIVALIAAMSIFGGHK